MGKRNFRKYIGSGRICFNVILWTVFIAVIFCLGQTAVCASQNQKGLRVNKHMSHQYVLSKKPRLPKQRKVSLRLVRVPLLSALTQLSTKAKVGISYQKDIIPNKKVTLDLNNISVFDALKKLLKNTDLEAVLPFSRDVLVIRKKQLKSSQILQETISGTVTDAGSGETLPGVNIRVKGTTTGTSTDIDGTYDLTVESLQDTLVFSFVGYKTKTVPVNGRNTVNVALKSQTLQGEEMVVVGYGQTSQKKLTGSVASVQGNDLASIPSSNLSQVLEGQAAGVSVTRTSGAPGAQSSIRIRGGNSINGDNSPLFVIDGLIVGKNFNLNNIDQSDIKSINILKDATATGIYGTRGANGVILITTKNGIGQEEGTTEVSINLSGGVQKLQNHVDLLNGPQQAEYANEDAEYRSATIPFSDLSKVPNTNWLNAITQDAPIVNGSIAVSGVSSDRKVNYRISGSYFNQQGIVKSSGIHKYNFRTNADVKLSKYFKTGIRFSVIRSFEDNNKVSFGNVLQFDLPSRAIYDENGNYTAINPVSGTTRANPLAEVNLQTNQNSHMNLLGNAYLQYEPTKHLILKSTIGPEFNYYKTNQYHPSTLPQKRIVGQGGDGNVNSGNYTNLLNNNTIEYTSDISTNHHIDLLGGFTWQTRQSEGVSAHAYDFTNDITKYNNLGNGSDPTRNQVGSNYGSYQLVSWLARANYSFKNKYLLTLVGRVDGSSRFAKTKNKYGFFPAAALAWRLSEEPFIKKLDIFDDLKLKGSYGISGSQSIGSYRSLPLLAGVTTLFNEQLQSGVRNGRPANPDLKWETTQQLNIGLNAGFFGGRLTFNAEYYHKKTKDLLLNVQIPRQTGFSSKLQNLGSIKNQGLEFEINSQNISNKEFRWTTRLNISGNRSKVVDLGGVQYINIASPSNQGGPGGRLIIGEPVPVFIGVKYLGTWKSQEEIDASNQSGTGQKVGGPHFEDTNGDGQITTQDFHPIGNPQPDFYGGIGNTIDFKNFTLDLFLQGSYGNEVFNSLTQTAFFGRPERNKYAETVNRWTPDNRDSDIPRAGTVSALSQVKNNTKEVEDGSYLRLKHLQVSYNLPLEKLNLKSFKKLSIYFSGENLFLLSNFQLFDPETSRYGDSNTAIGFTYGTYPYSSIYTLGIKAAL